MMNYDEDSTLNELKNRIQLLKEQRSNIMNELISERKEVEVMQTEMGKMKKEKSYLEGLIKEKGSAMKEYDRIIHES
jgi:predicted nuclease with TOPRIM domain